MQEKLDRGFWFMLSDPEMTYLCTKGPYISKEARDSAIITEVEKRNEQAVFKKGNKFFDIIFFNKFDRPVHFIKG